MENKIDQNEEAGDEVLKAVGALEESYEELEEVMEESQDQEDSVVEALIWIGKLIKKVLT